MNAATTRKNTQQLRKGDIVWNHGGRFEITTDLMSSVSHRPEGYYPAEGVGPSCCVTCKGTCLEGEVPGYFKPGSEWTFQGNHLATWAVEVN